MKKCCSTLRKTKGSPGCLILFAILLVSSVALAQQKEVDVERIGIKGRVVDTHKKPVTGAKVRVKGYPVYTLTDGKGRYTIDVPASSSALTFSYTGMQREEVPLDGKRTINVVMKMKAFSWDSFHILPDFHLNRFRDQNSGLKGLAECHFTVANAANPQNIALCEELGLAVMITEAPHLREKEWAAFTDEEIEEKIKRMVRNGGDSPAIIGYYLADEPHVSSFPALGKAVAAVRKYAPGKLAYINLFPGNGTAMKDGELSKLGTKTYTEYLERYVQEVKPQFLCYDNYRVQYSMDFQDMTLGAGYFNSMLEVRRIALKYHLPFFNIVAANQIRPRTTIPSPANMLLQAYTTLAAGAHGLQWYAYHYSGPTSKYDYTALDKNENKTLTWRYLEEVNRQVSVLGPFMKNLTSTGVYFTAPPLIDNLPLMPGQWIEHVESEVPMMIGEFVNDEGEKFAMVVNLSMERSAKFSIKPHTPGEKIWIVSAAEDEVQLMEMDRIAKPELGARGGYWLVAGQGILLKLGGRQPDANP